MGVNLFQYKTDSLGEKHSFEKAQDSLGFLLAYS